MTRQGTEGNYDKGIRDSYTSPITIPMIKFKRKGSAGHVARIGADVQGFAGEI